MHHCQSQTGFGAALVVVGLGLWGGCETSQPPAQAPAPAPAPGAGPAMLPEAASAPPSAGGAGASAGASICAPTEVGKPKTTASGLTYETLQVGSGPMAKHGDRVTVHYVGTLEDGKVFDSSRDRNEPMTFTIGEDRFVLGWNEGVEGMQAGERRKLTLPPNLGYGALGRLPAVPPNATLNFEVELLKIEPK